MAMVSINWISPIEWPRNSIFPVVFQLGTADALRKPRMVSSAPVLVTSQVIWISSLLAYVEDTVTPWNWSSRYWAAVSSALTLTSSSVSVPPPPPPVDTSIHCHSLLTIPSARLALLV